jgi:hypothetical protein
MSVGESDLLLTGEVLSRLQEVLQALTESCCPMKEALDDIRWHVAECPEGPDLHSAEDLLAQFDQLVGMLEKTCPLVEEALETLRWNDAWRRCGPEQQIIAMRRRADWLEAAGDKGDARLWRWEATRRERELRRSSAPSRPRQKPRTVDSSRSVAS